MDFGEKKVGITTVSPVSSIGKGSSASSIHSVSTISPKDYTSIAVSPPGWRPAYLRKRVITGFAIIFCAIIIALEILNYVSSKNQGLTSSTESRHYLWTYGPTAILTLVSAFWARVEFQAKQSAPWQAMLKGPEESGKSVLLDYISQMQPFALVRAIRNRHYPVISGISGSLLLRLLIIISTSLFSLQEVKVHKKNVLIQVQGNLSTLSTADFSTTYSEPFDTVNGILFEGVSYLDGTTSNFSFPTFSASSMSNDSVIIANVTGLAPDLECENATLDVEVWQMVATWINSKSSAGSHQVQENVLSTSSCTLYNVSIDIPSNQELGIEVTLKTSYAARYQTAQCEGSTDLDGKRIVLVAVETEMSPNVTTSAFGNYTSDGIEFYGNSDWHTTTRNITVIRSAAAICKPKISLVKLLAKTNMTESSSTTGWQKLGEEITTLPNLTAWDIASNVNSESHDTDGYQPISSSTQFPETDDTLVDVDYAIQLGAVFTGKTGNVSHLFENDMLSDAASAYHRATGAQLLREGFLSQKTSESTGSAIVSENRVVMTQFTLRAMEACLILIITFVIAMIVFVPRGDLAPYNPTTISATAAIMSNSKMLRKRLHGSSSMPLENISVLLDGKRYYTELALGGFSIAAMDDDTKICAPCENLPDHKTQNPKWSPFPNSTVRMIVFIVVGCLIAALEAILQISQRDDGLGNVSSSSGIVHYIWTMIPALVMVLIGLAFSSMNSHARSLAPYVHLRDESGTASSQFMTLNFNDALDVTNLVSSTKLRQYAVLATTLSTLITSVLTIVTSGLYTATDISGNLKRNFNQTTTFHNANSDNETSGITTAKYILLDNLDYPKWTYQNLAFPKLSFNASSLTKKQSTNSYVDIIVPAMRGTLTCELQTNTSLQASWIDVDNRILYTVFAPTCDSNSTSPTWTNQSVLSDELSSTQTMFGFEQEVECKGNNNNTRTSIAGTVESETAASQTATLTKGGGAISYIWGELQNKTITHIAALTCREWAEIVDTKTRFILPDFNISTEVPPQPDESTARRVQNYTDGEDWYWVDGIIADSSIDNFFEALVEGKYAIPMNYLRLEKYNEKVASAIKFQSEIVKAQQFNTYNRISIEESSGDEYLIQGNITTSGGIRLFQDAVSTRVLEALLGVLLILGALGSWLMNTDHVLPKNPCSIAAVASLLADSNFLHRYGPGVGDPNAKQVEERLFADCRFFMGMCYDGPLRGFNDDRFTIYLTDYGMDKKLAATPEG
ncbi:uncharacterized protein N7483_005628 [Penicillium malachiteum]|uniref:uncharacterized protein n=1 Tax=Penicillium malachiteum TaxID=1324776 RepID=UPI0025467D98|nr:uncharacterized protein N7483_005628 [Penicillium malachiteum]KAJ5731120.1 hypothetical protein N7483_005628 [Penicillium malachiteum]